MSAKADRHELKYEISDAGVLLLRGMLPALLSRDAHAGPDGRYFIRSLYFDDTDRSAYRDKLSGADPRVKFRLRYYNFDEGRILLEKKEKLGGLCRKTAERVSRAAAEALIGGGEPEGGGPLLTELLALRRALPLQPSAIVDYDREAFAGPVSNTRLTLDLNVRAAPYSKGFFSRELLTVPVLPEGTQILEVKYDEFLPAHIGEAAGAVPARRLAISKYALALNILE